MYDRGFCGTLDIGLVRQACCSIVWLQYSTVTCALGMQRSGSQMRYVYCALVVALLCISGENLQCSAERRLPQALATGVDPSQKHSVIVRYHVDRTAGGLINQILCHIGAFLLAVPLRAEIMLPDALSRKSFDTKWWQQEWHSEPLQSLLEVEEIIRYWRKRGILVHQVGPGKRLPPQTLI